MKLHFTKMQGLGNDFVVIDGTQSTLQFNSQQLAKLTDRHFGIGCDQVLLLQNSETNDADFKFRIFNSDGSEVEQCGNGARCMAHYIYEKGLSEQRPLRLATSATCMELESLGESHYRIAMGEPIFTPNKIPFKQPNEAASYQLALADDHIEIGAVSLGNPHCVIQVSNVADANCNTLGKQITRHPQFPKGCNVGFMQIVARDHIKLRVYERGAGETLACGSGACAAVVVGIRQGFLDKHVRVELSGGELQIDWEGPGMSVYMSGPAENVFEGTIVL